MGRIGLKLGMAGHAGFGGWDAGEGGFLDGGVAIAAIDSKSCIMVLMAKRHGLTQGNLHARRIGRPINRIERPTQETDKSVRRPEC